MRGAAALLIAGLAVASGVAPAQAYTVLTIIITRSNPQPVRARGPLKMSIF